MKKKREIKPYHQMFNYWGGGGTNTMYRCPNVSYCKYAQKIFSTKEELNQHIKKHNEDDKTRDRAA